MVAFAAVELQSAMHRLRRNMRLYEQGVQHIEFPQYIGRIVA